MKPTVWTAPYFRVSFALSTGETADPTPPPQGGAPMQACNENYFQLRAVA